MPPLAPCPHLPPAPPGLSWRHLHAQREDSRGDAFYVACLEYGQSLWQQALPARAILCLDRAMGADLDGTEPSLQRWPMPYAALAWMLANLPPGAFVGNPRVHFQHYADRINEPRREARRWRAWACWAITRALQPTWPADPRHSVREPAAAEIAQALRTHGLVVEAELWAAVLHSSATSPAGPFPAKEDIR